MFPAISVRRSVLPGGWTSCRGTVSLVGSKRFSSWRCRGGSEDGQARLQHSWPLPDELTTWL